MKIEETALPDVVKITPQRFGDARGFFSECWKKSAMDEAGLVYDFVQDNHSMSAVAGTLRGLHFQAPPYAQAKLVRCGRGALFDVVVDIRNGSPTYGQWAGEVLSYDNGAQLLVPEGFAHGFVTLEPMTEIIYKCSSVYAPDADGGVHWDSCGVDWPIKEDLVLSKKDVTATPLSEFISPFEYVS